ncbi:MAG: hypothetical protein RMI83_00490 [Desulfurococcaceae archaeon]|nr:hypothetical protein [Sulfolobales archaeon]MDW8169575.1 hypothetical protein [Desulfurococcaceae archaeon]
MKLKGKSFKNSEFSQRSVYELELSIVINEISEKLGEWIAN